MFTPQTRHFMVINRSLESLPKSPRSPLRNLEIDWTSPSCPSMPPPHSSLTSSSVPSSMGVSIPSSSMVVASSRARA